jgi:hypothetical protein
MIRYQNQLYSLSQAVAAGLIDPRIWRWDGFQYVSETAPTASFPPFDARWVHANVPLTLIMSRRAPLAPALAAHPAALMARAPAALMARAPAALMAPWARRARGTAGPLFAFNPPASRSRRWEWFAR